MIAYPNRHPWHHARSIACATVAALALAALPRRAAAQPAVAQPAPADTTVRVTYGAFVDGYFAYDAGRPASFDRSFAGGAPFTTQPSRHNEFNINLAYVEAVLAGARVRGRFALQAGTSVQSNYAGEPVNGTISGPSLARHIQEAVVGYKIADHVWIDGGIFYSNMGMEGWVSRDNPTYTRSLVGDYSPYYSTGVKATWAATPKLTARLDIVNGWQNISENNSGKGAGIRLDYAVTPTSTLSYYNFISSEAGSRVRSFNGVGAKLATAGGWTLLGEADYGTQSRPAGAAGTSSWINTAAIVRRQVAPTIALSGRVEYMRDPDQVVLATGTRGSGATAIANAPFRAVGASVGVDVQPQARFLWRSEVRGWQNRDAIFPDGRNETPSKRSGFVVSSLALTF
ncbi:outer membrane beta-barrel protein [Gemmatimonas groenlandica]|uniref:Porin n=1 Tax=Gemmatimonas groenlandica TaxID=2732249 RepID=A0A6M4IS91_9BACT|nr:outer membrane beta-barrel protein [Gemmatimonas groenlandica]QJR36306.1 porin [Gemmatimonas groenlandica]